MVQFILCHIFCSVLTIAFDRYHRGQTVQVEGKKARFVGVISAIGTEAV